MEESLEGRKGHRFLALLPEIDKEVALELIGQLPEDAATFAPSRAGGLRQRRTTPLSAFEHARPGDGSRGQHLERLAILKAEPNKDLSPEERMRVLDDIREVQIRARA